MNREYAFDIKLIAVCRVTAATLEAARAEMRNQLDALEINHERDGIRITEVSIEHGDKDEPLGKLFEIDGDVPEECSECGCIEGEPEWGTGGDGFDGMCPSCADKAETERED